MPWGVSVPPSGRRPCAICEAAELTDLWHAQEAAAFERARRRDAERTSVDSLRAAALRNAYGWREAIIRRVACEALVARVIRSGGAA